MDDGTVGIGEVSPYPSHSHETKESIVYVMKHYLSPLLISAEAFDTNKLLDQVDEAIVGNAFGKACVDIAIHDAVSKGLKVPLYVMLGGKVREKIPLAKAINMDSPEKMAEEAINYVNEGFRTLKLYVGLDPEEDIERIKAVRKEVGEYVEIEIDVNQRWTPKIAINTIRKMERYDLLLVEQPVPRWDLDGLKQVQKSVDVPICVDESLGSPQDALEIIKREAADVFNVYVTKSGGLRKAKSILTIAQSAGIPYLIGSLYELSIGTSAGVHLASSSSTVKYACDLIGPTLRTYDVVNKPLRIEEGYACVPSDPGLGVGDAYESVFCLST
jgi:L-alanine-DL-glutamate epimerase-like enolase superfamily enzyme